MARQDQNLPRMARHLVCLAIKWRDKETMQWNIRYCGIHAKTKSGMEKNPLCSQRSWLKSSPKSVRHVGAFESSSRLKGSWCCGSKSSVQTRVLKSLKLTLTPDMLDCNSTPTSRIFIYGSRSAQVEAGERECLILSRRVDLMGRLADDLWYKIMVAALALMDQITRSMSSTLLVEAESESLLLWHCVGGIEETGNVVCYWKPSVGVFTPPHKPKGHQCSDIKSGRKRGILLYPRTSIVFSTEKTKK